MARVPRHLVVAASSWASRIVVSASSILNIRMLIEGLGQERYAGFLLLNSLLGWYALSDLGIGNSVGNSIAERRAREQPYDGLITGAAIGSLTLLVALGLALLALAPWLGPIYLEKVPEPDAARARYFLTAGILFVGFTAGNVAYRIWYAEQRGYLANIATACGSLLGLAGTWWATHLEGRDRLGWSVFAWLFPPALASLSSLAWVVANRGTRDLVAAIGELRTFAPTAVRFWGFSSLAALVLYADTIVISQMLPPKDVVVYGIATRFFDVINLFYGALLLALWPTCTELITKRQWGDVFAYLRRYLAIGLSLIALCSVGLMVGMPWVLPILSPKEVIVIPVAFMGLLGLLALIRTWTNTYAMVLQSVSALRPLFITTPLQALANAGLQLLLAPRFGVYGVTSGLILSYLLTTAWVLPVAVVRASRVRTS